MADRFADTRTLGRALLEFASPRVRDSYADELGHETRATLSGPDPEGAGGLRIDARPELATTAEDASRGRSHTATGQELSDAILPRPAPRRSQRAGAALAAVLLIAIGRAAWVRHTTSTESPASVVKASLPSLPTAQDWVVACPPLAAVGADEPGWLGAAAAATFCARARLLLGGRPEHTRVPAELLGLPSTLSTNFPEAPYDGVDARERALAAARRANAYLDGEVRDLGVDFDVELVLRSPDGRELASGRGRSPALYVAVREATLPLLASGVLPRLPLDPTIARWISTESVDDALALFDMQLATAYVAGTFESECATVARLPVEVGAQLDYWRWHCAFVRGRTVPTLVAPVPSSEDAAEFAQQALLFHVAENTDSRQIALRLQAFGRDPASGDWGRSVLAGVEACFWQSIDLDSAQAAALRGVEAAPQNPDYWFCSPWNLLMTTLAHGPGALSAARAVAAWQPWSWSPVRASDRSDPALASRRARHAYRLAPENAYVQANLFDVLLAAGNREGARAVALRYRGHEAPVLALESEILLSRLDANEVRFGAALERARRALEAPVADGYAREQLMELAGHAFRDRTSARARTRVRRPGGACPDPERADLTRLARRAHP